MTGSGGTRRVLVTGGAGFVGSQMAAHCLARGDEVHVLVRPGTDCRRIQALDAVHRHALCLSDGEAVAALVAAVAPDEVYHFAARTRRPADETGCSDAIGSVREDVDGLLTLLHALTAAHRPPRALVRAGSLAEYGAAPPPFVETQRERPLNAYTAALVAGTHYAQMLQPRLPFPVITARLALIYGPTQSRSFLVPRLFAFLTEGRTVRLQNPDHRRDLIHVDDAVEAMGRLAALDDAEGLVVNVASGRSDTVAAIAEEVRAALGASSSLVQHCGGTGKAPSPGGTVSDLTACVDRLQRLLRWSPSVALREGFARMAAAATQNTGAHRCFRTER